MQQGMKKIVLSMVALLSLTVAVAQDAKSDKKAPKEPTAEEMTNRMAQDLKLTDEQKTKVLALNKEYQDVLKAPRGPRGPRPEGKQGKRPQTDGKTEATEQQGGKQKGQRPELTEEQKAKFKAHHAKREEYDKKLKQILTDDQYKSWKKRHGRHGGHRNGQRQQTAND